ncbi:MAG: sulfotransferase [Gemmataceae bacterium]|nr:sulfotransferase [Gemmataceae bacterium]
MNNPPPKKPEWAPRIWEGCDFFAWLRLLARNRFQVHWSCIYIAVIVTFVSVFHTLLRWLQEAVYGRVLRKTSITQAPIFILGHWRTGTTLLHEFLIRDQRFGYPTTYECLDPHHFLLTEQLFSKYLWFLVPTHRPMDNMKAGFDRPQEEEFALCMMGTPSPYLTIAFPNNKPQFPEYLDLEGLTPAALRDWKRSFQKFLKQVTFKQGKRLVLKSPPHTARIRALKEMFPDALFLHIVRDPRVVFASTVNLWRTLYRLHGLQKPTFAGLEEQVLATFERMYDRLEAGKKLLEPRQFYELKYEDLIQDPVGQLRRVYEHFQLGGWQDFEPRLQAYLASIKGYETNKYQLTPEQEAQVAARWGDVIKRYGYASL